MKAKTQKIMTVMVLVSTFTVGLAKADNLVTQKEIHNYVERYLREYKVLVEAYGSALGNLSAFTFCLGYPYKVTGVISRSHGAAIFFEPALSEEILVRTINERIEFYLWPVMKEYSAEDFWELPHGQSNGFGSYVFYANLQIGDGVTPTYAYDGGRNILAILADSYTIQVKPLGRLRIDGTLIYENRMILKGSNEADRWAPETALLDSTLEFLRIARKLALDEAKQKEIECYTLLYAKAEQIQRKLATGAYGDPFNWRLWTIDEDEFWKIAEECGISSETAAKIRKEVLEKYKTQEWFEHPILTHIVIPFLIGIAGTIVFTLFWKPKWWKRRLKKLTKSLRHEKKSKK